jgi:hypothetical protein
MNIDFANIPSSQIVWGILIVLAVILVVVVIRFFWQHVLPYLLHGCLVIVGIIALLVLLQYLNIIHLPWPF